MTQSEAHMSDIGYDMSRQRDRKIVCTALMQIFKEHWSMEDMKEKEERRRGGKLNKFLALFQRREAAAAEIRRQEKLARQAKKDEQDRIKLQEKKRREEVKAYWRLKKEFDTFVDERIALDKAREKKRSKEEKRNAKKLKKNISKSKDNSNNSTANENDNNNISHKSIPENKTSDYGRKGKKSGLKPSLLKIRKVFVPSFLTAGGMAPVKVDKLDYIFFLWVNHEIPIVFLDRSNVMNSNVLTL